MKSLNRGVVRVRPLETGINIECHSSDPIFDSNRRSHDNLLIGFLLHLKSIFSRGLVFFTGNVPENLLTWASWHFGVELLVRRASAWHGALSLAPVIQFWKQNFNQLSPRLRRVSEGRHFLRPTDRIDLSFISTAFWRWLAWSSRRATLLECYMTHTLLSRGSIAAFMASLVTVYEA